MSEPIEPIGRPPARDIQRGDLLAYAARFVARRRRILDEAEKTNRMTAEVVRHLHRLGVPPREIAEMFGVTRQMVHRWISAERK